MEWMNRILTKPTAARSSESALWAQLARDPRNPDLHVEMARLARAMGETARVRYHLDQAFEAQQG